MADCDGLMGWNKWSARHVERGELVMPQGVKVKATHTPEDTAEIREEVIETITAESVWPWVSGQKRREDREEKLKSAVDPETLMERRRWRR